MILIQTAANPSYNPITVTAKDYGETEHFSSAAEAADWLGRASGGRKPL